LSDQDLVEYINRLDYLYIMAIRYRDFWYADSTKTNWRRWWWARERYRTACVDCAYQIGMAGELREDEG
jgi:hypothetical protein